MYLLIFDAIFDVNLSVDQKNYKKNKKADATIAQWIRLSLPSCLPPKALKSCPKSNKSPNLVTLGGSRVELYI